MQQIINTELTKKGKTPVTQDPDFYVAYAAGTDMDAVKEKLDAAGKKTIEKTPEAAMVLILIDAETGVIIGVSTAEGEAKGLPAEETKKRLGRSPDVGEAIMYANIRPDEGDYVVAVNY